MLRMPRRDRRLPLRLALTIALVYALHAAPNVVREVYLAVSLGERLSIRVDPYVGLHPDLFEIPGRGAYINNNPGASLLGAVPYALVLPALEWLYRAQPSFVAPKPATTYDDGRPNRTTFMNEMRARGLDVRLGLGAITMQLGVNVPLGVLAGLVLFLFLRARLEDERGALWLAVLFAFGTPVFFRSAFLNQNLVLAYCTLFAYLSLVSRVGDEARLPRRGAARLGMAGGLLGVGLLCDYSAAPMWLVFAAWVIVLGARDGGLGEGIRAGALFAIGSAGPIAALLLYQQEAFGNPFLPAQAYMARTDLSGNGWHGVSIPQPALLWGNLFDSGYGLLAFCPMLVASVFAPRYRRMRGGLGWEELALIYGASAALYAFASSVAFAALQWNTGIRYMVPSVPLLFLGLVPVLVHATPVVRWALVVPTLVVSWSVSMVRENVTTSLLTVFTGGPELPWHIVLAKTSPAYLPFLSGPWTPLACFLLLAVTLALVWRGPSRRAGAT